MAKSVLINQNSKIRKSPLEQSRVIARVTSGDYVDVINTISYAGVKWARTKKGFVA